LEASHPDRFVEKVMADYSPDLIEYSLAWLGGLARRIIDVVPELGRWVVVRDSGRLCEAEGYEAWKAGAFNR
jgi:hypothetical protein